MYAIKDYVVKNQLFKIFNIGVETRLYLVSNILSG